MIWAQTSRLVNVGVHKDTPELLINRIVYSNIAYVIGLMVAAIFCLINFFKSYYFLMSLNVFYLIAVYIGFYLNYRRSYLAGRVIALSTVYVGLFLTGLYQGPHLESQNFFIPLAVLAVCTFTPKERKYSVIFVVTALTLYLFVMAQDHPLIPGNLVHYQDSDRSINRIGAAVYFALMLFAVSNSFDRAIEIINHQKAKLFDERKMALIGSMACNVAHEINSPLAALDLHLYNLGAAVNDGQLTSGEVAERLKKMNAITRRITVIVRGLKFLSRQENNDPLSVRSVSSVIDSAIDISREKLDTQNIRLQMDLDFPDELIACRPIAVSQVFLNLINNAIDAVYNQPAENRWIRVASRRTPSKMEISVEDGGPPVTSQIRANLFRSFYTH
jgi:signal transduction histidine kinase